jgi:hypothetical protein
MLLLGDLNVYLKGEMRKRGVSHNKIGHRSQNKQDKIKYPHRLDPKNNIKNKQGTEKQVPPDFTHVGSKEVVLVEGESRMVATRGRGGEVKGMGRGWPMCTKLQLVTEEEYVLVFYCLAQ